MLLRRTRPKLPMQLGKESLALFLRGSATLNSKPTRQSSVFLKRIAWVESKFGTDRRTFRTGYHGGIWQIDLKAFRDTQDVNAHPGLTEKYQRIKNTFGIDWIMVPWSECRKPLYSALAAWLYLSNNPRPIPADVEGQAEYWKLYYNTSCGAGTVKKFLEDVKEIDCTEE